MKHLTKPLVKAATLSALLTGASAEGSLDTLFQNAFRDSLLQQSRSNLESVTNGVSMYEKENKLYIEAPLPGVDEKDVELILEKGILAIQGERKNKQEGEEEARYFYRSSNNFSYRIVLPETADLEKPEATFKNGLMNVVFEKKTSSQPRRLEFNS